MPALSAFAVLQYDGRHFSGWQRQPHARTVQGAFEAVLERLCDGRVPVHAAGRTDAGVHALAQVVSFHPPSKWALPDLLRALRALSPPDLWTARLGPAPPGFHARKHALTRRYRYVVGTDPEARSPFRRPYEWCLGRPLDGTLLEAAARTLRGERQFRAFAAAGPPKAHYRSRVVSADWQARAAGEGFIFTIEADRFLHHMVRFLVGTMVDIAGGRRPLGDMERLLGATHNHDTSPPAPPEGLFFVGARYPALGEGYAQ